MKTKYRNFSPKGRRAPFLTRTRLLIFLGGVVLLGILLGLSFFWARQKLSAHYDTLIVNGMIVDGTGAPRRAGTIGIRGGRIVEVEWAAFATADRVIDAEEHIVAPGFIDVHTHIERNVENLTQPLAAENFLAQGFTTIVTGNCGRSAPSLAQFFGQLESTGTALNVASLVGHNTVRRQVMGDAARAAGTDEISRMRSLIERAMNDGALGFSSGLEYEPGMFAARSELEALAGVAGRHKGIYATHLRDEGNAVSDSVREAIEVARKAGVALEISHLKARGRTNWGEAKALLEMLQQAERDGLRVTCDAYPYTASSTTIDLLLPQSARAGGAANLRARLRNPSERARIVDGVLALMRSEGWEDFSFARVAYFHYDKELNGLTIPEVAARLDKSRLQEIPPPSAPVVSASDPALVQAAEDEEVREVSPKTTSPKPEPVAAEPSPAGAQATPEAEIKNDAKKIEPSQPTPAGAVKPSAPAPADAPKKDEKAAPPAPPKALPQSSPKPSSNDLSSLRPSFYKTVALRVDAPRRAAEGGDAVREQAEAVCWMAAHGGAQMIFENMSDTDLVEILRFPGCMLGSDSGVRTVGEGRPHPRGFGSAPRYLGRFTRDEKLFTLEEAIRRITSLPAETFGIAERGKLLPGYWADVVIFDPERVQDLASYTDPFRAPEGISHVLVNGEVAYERGQSKQLRAGRIIRRQNP